MRKYMIGFICGVIVSVPTLAFASYQEMRTIVYPVKYLFNGEEKHLPEDAVTLNYNGRTYVPARFVADQLGAAVGYDSNTRSVSFLFNEEGVISDPDQDMIKVSNIKVVPKGNDSYEITADTMIHEQFIGQDAVFAVSMYFYKEGQLLGEADYGQPIHFSQFPAGKVNRLILNKPFDKDITAFTDVELKVHYVGENPIKGTTPPELIVHSNESEAPATLGDFLWSSIGDAFVTEEHIRKIQAGSGDELQLSFAYPHSPVVAVYLGDLAQDEFVEYEKYADGVLTVPSAPGEYTFKMAASWSSHKTQWGHADYYLKVIVTE